jgi:hypothetical protein
MPPNATVRDADLPVIIKWLLALTGGSPCDATRAMPVGALISVGAPSGIFRGDARRAAARANRVSASSNQRERNR